MNPPAPNPIPLHPGAINGPLNPNWHPAVNPAHAYQGFLGSESTRFDIYDQHTTDIHLVDYYPPLAAPKIRQRTAAIAQGLSFASPEQRVQFNIDAHNWPINEVWAPAPFLHVAALRFYNLGPSQPGPFNQWPFGVFEIPVVAWTGGQLRNGHLVRWFYEVVEWRQGLAAANNIITYPMFYHEHKRRGPDEHAADLPIVKDGKRCQFDELHFGTQIQVYRRATLEDL